MSIRRRTRAKQNKTEPRTRRARTRVGAAPRVRVLTPSPRQATPNRRATFELGAPRITLDPWRTTRDWRASRPKFFAAVVLIVLLLGLYQLFNNDMFFVNDIALSGNKIVPRGEVSNTAGVRGWNIFFVEPAALKARVRAMPEFKDVQVDVTLPNEVDVDVFERTPRFVWESGGKNYWVDGEGIAMRARGNVPNGWQLREAEGTTYKYGDRVNSDAFNAAVSLLNAWQAAPHYFEWTRQHGLTVRESHGWLTYFGSANQMADKIAAFKIVSDQILREKRAVTLIDLGSGLPYYQEAITATAKK